MLKLKHNKRLKRDCQRAAFPVPLSRGVAVVVFEFSGMRCQPLRRALCEFVAVSRYFRFGK
ncbi:hypothetical protein FLM09_10125 [Vibrio cholerae]|nr:hypothetical protein FLM09_10125 [Vibrio cholerae]